jgi:hypothetical protein
MLIWLAVTVAFGVDAGLEASARAQLLLVIFSAPGATLLAIGLLGEWAARTYDAADRAYADAVAASLDQLGRVPRAEAYRLDDPADVVHAARLVGVARLDQLERVAPASTLEQVETALEAQLGSFADALIAGTGDASRPTHASDVRRSRSARLLGGTERLADIELTISGATRQLLADGAYALFQVAAAPNPRTGPLRGLGLPGAAVEHWMRDLIEAAVHRLGGSTHVGGTLMAARRDLVARFRPDALDRLERDPARPELARIGPAEVLLRAGNRGADTVLATSVQRDSEELLLLPSAFPTLLGRALAAAALETELADAGKRRRRPA